MRVAVSIVAFALAGCSPSPPGTVPETSPANVTTPVGMITPTVTSSPKAVDLTGRWIGVEGMFLNVSPLSAGRYILEMQYDLDHRGSFAGTSEGDGIAFERGGIREVLRPTGGAATGLKYLADKTDCLTVKSGEGYCRR